MTTNIILHGHFYQPPRENPATGKIPLQESALPYSDWNKRISCECYRANAFSRFLSYDGRITDITNNYRRISFNFGPTLLKWLRSESEETYWQIIDADRESYARLNRHGNALAQSYNHTILPLDTPEDAVTQLMWGLEDFRFHFNRDPEGLWLPETAISPRLIDLLASSNISFVILSPWQAEKIVRDTGRTIDLNGLPAPFDEPFRLEGKTGAITAFFYHPELASGISFGHFLRDADALHAKIAEFAGIGKTRARIDPQTHRYSPTHQYPLLHTATDGEIYGHHEPFGDMGLAALIKKIDDDPALALTNYGAYLENHPPTASAVLKAGEDNRGTSWSCSHGVSRWYKDCGCATGGKSDWNQKWRTPLREGFDNLRKDISEIYKREAAEISEMDPEKILHLYGKVVVGYLTPEQFIGKIFSRNEAGPQGKYSERDKSRLLTLLEGAKFSLFMFTSCGWFFSDISGIEPMQNMRYAVHAIKLYAPFTNKKLLHKLEQDLDKAQSNILEMPSGKVQLRSLVPEVSGTAETAVFFALNLIFAEQPQDKKTIYGLYQLRDSADYGGNCRQVTIRNSTLLIEHTCQVTLYIDNNNDLIFSISIENDADAPLEISASHLPPHLLLEAAAWIQKSISLAIESSYCKTRLAFKVLSSIHRTAPSAVTARMMPDAVLLGRSILQAAHLLKEQPLSCPEETSTGREDPDELLFLINFILEFGSDQDAETLRQLTDNYFQHKTKILSSPEPVEVNTIKNMLAEVRQIIKSSLTTDTTELQEAVFMRLHENNQIIGNSNSGHHSQAEYSSQAESAVLFQLAELINIAGQQ